MLFLVRLRIIEGVSDNFGAPHFWLPSHSLVRGSNKPSPFQPSPRQMNFIFTSIPVVVLASLLVHSELFHTSIN